MCVFVQLKTSIFVCNYLSLTFSLLRSVFLSCVNYLIYECRFKLANLTMANIACVFDIFSFYCALVCVLYLFTFFHCYIYYWCCRWYFELDRPIYMSLISMLCHQKLLNGCTHYIEFQAIPKQHWYCAYLCKWLIFWNSLCFSRSGFLIKSQTLPGNGAMEWDSNRTTGRSGSIRSRSSNSS